MNRCNSGTDSTVWMEEDLPFGNDFDCSALSKCSGYFFIKEVAMNSNVRKLTTMAILAAISVVLVWLVHFPIFPAVAFLEYDPADIAVLICGFAFGPVAGICVTLVAALVQGITVSAASGIYGIIMHILATAAFVLTSSLIYRKKKTKKTAAISIAAGVVAMTLVMIPANLFITPFFMNCERALVIDLLPFIAGFNAIKAGVNGIITFFVYKKISRLIHKFEEG